MSDPLLALTLTLIAAVETNSGTDLAHKPIRNIASIHYGDRAIGRFGMMPETLKWLGTTDDEEGARKLATRILARNRAHRGYACPFEIAVLQWERGPYTRIDKNAWSQGNAKTRLDTATRLGRIKRTKWSKLRFYN